MADGVISLVVDSSFALGKAFFGLLILAVVFATLALIVKGRRALADARRALPETRVTLIISAFNIVFIVPFIVLFSTWMSNVFSTEGIQLINPSTWEWLPNLIVIFAAIFAGDFIGYWRHRIEHTQLLWPSHAVHHSDTEMTWLSLERFHPVNRLTTMAIDSAGLLLLGFPADALIANFLVRHFYGYFIHADLPWTYGRWGGVFVSPAMHRWHHAVDEAAYLTNFATVFSVFDRMFGTFRVPGPCTAVLGVAEHMGTGTAGLLTYPFRPRAYHQLMRGTSQKARQAAMLILSIGRKK